MSNIVSTKYQIVIPRNVRKQLGIVAGQKMRVTATKDGGVLLEKDDTPTSLGEMIDRYAGSIRGVWHDEGLTAAEWLERERSSWVK